MDDEAIQEEQKEIVYAEVTAVTANGVKLKLAGEDSAGLKEYKVNAMQRLEVGDLVKVDPESGTYVVEYAVGAPMSRYPIPSGGTDGQYLVKDGTTNYAVKWINAPSYREVPSTTGVTLGNVLTVVSGGYGWSGVPSELPSGGTSGQFLQKTSTGTAWASVPSELPSMSSSTSGKYLTNNGSTVSWDTPSVAALKSGTYTVTLSSATLTPSTTIHLGSSSSSFGNLYANGNVKLGSGTSSTLGFFGATPVNKRKVQSTDTLQTLIKALTNYGLIGTSGTTPT